MRPRREGGPLVLGTDGSVRASGDGVQADSLCSRPDRGCVTVTPSNRLAALEGRVHTAAAGGEASTSAVVVIAAEPTTRIVSAVQTTQRGRFSVENLPPGDYAVAAVPSAALPAGIAFDVREVTDPAVITRILPHATRVTLSANESATVDLREGAIAPRRPGERAE